MRAACEAVLAGVPYFGVCFEAWSPVLRRHRFTSLSTTGTLDDASRDGVAFIVRSLGTDGIARLVATESRMPGFTPVARPEHP
jgi:hypothetical protein